MLFAVLMLPFLLQGMAFTLDEFVYHRRRGLPLWERLGHPIDTATIILPLIFVFWNEFSVRHLLEFSALGLLSCLVVTKDEFVHAANSSPREQWLHSVLFVLHPLLFVTIGIFWYTESIGVSLIPAQRDLAFLLKGQIGFLSCILAYQIIYWSLIWPRKQLR